MVHRLSWAPWLLLGTISEPCRNDLHQTSIQVLDLPRKFHVPCSDRHGNNFLSSLLLNAKDQTLRRSMRLRVKRPCPWLNQWQIPAAAASTDLESFGQCFGPLALVDEAPDSALESSAEHSGPELKGLKQFRTLTVQAHRTSGRPILQGSRLQPPRASQAIAKMFRQTGTSQEPGILGILGLGGHRLGACRRT